MLYCLVRSCSKEISSEHQRRQAAGDGGDAPEVVVADIAEHRALYGVATQPGGVHGVELLLLQGGEEALHPGVIIAASGTAHALDCYETIRYPW